MSKSKRDFIGLDFETSGTTHERHAPIQLGLATQDGSYASWLIGGWRWAGPSTVTGPEYEVGTQCWEWDEGAYGVHGITQEALEKFGMTPGEVTADAIAFLQQHSQAWRGERIMVGWNVGSFDAPFLRRYLPGIAREMSYRSVDLNAVTYTIAEAHGIKSKTLKRQAQEAGAERALTIPSSGTWKLHDAGYDAVAALGAWDYLKARIQEGY